LVTHGQVGPKSELQEIVPSDVEIDVSDGDEVARETARPDDRLRVHAAEAFLKIRRLVREMGPAINEADEVRVVSWVDTDQVGHDLSGILTHRNESEAGRAELIPRKRAFALRTARPSVDLATR
jgi:hypothetical protein